MDLRDLESAGGDPCLEISTPISVNLELLASTTELTSGADEHAIFGTSRRGKVQAAGYSDGSSAWIDIPAAGWANMVAVTLGGGGGYPSSATFYIALNPGHFHQGHKILEYAQVIQLNVQAVGPDPYETGKKPSFELHVELHVEGEAEGESLSRDAKIIFNPPQCGLDQYGGGCALGFTKQSSCTSTPADDSAIWGGTKGEYGDAKCGTAPLGKYCERGDSDCKADHIGYLEHSCRQCCAEKASHEHEQGCCQFTWEYSKPSLCTWSAGYQRNRGKGAAVTKDSKDDDVALTCDCRRKGSCSSYGY